MNFTRMHLTLTACLLLLGGCLGTPAVERPPLPEVAHFLWSDPYPDLVVEIDHVNGWEPLSGAVDLLVRTLEEETDKRDVTVLPYERLPRKSPNANVAYEWTRSELVALAKHHLDSAPPRELAAGNAAVLHVLFLDGAYEGLVGVAIGRTAFLFEPRGDETGWGTMGESGLNYQRSVLIHEVGHVLGLVDRGVPMVRDHAHPDDPHHSVNPESVMWPWIDSMSALLALLELDEPPPHTFDADDRADLAAFRELGRARTRTG